jgi:hypothetical protein
MHHLFWSLASTVEISDSVNHWFRRSSSMSENAVWGLVFLGILALWVGLYFWDRARRPPKRTDQGREGLFLQLCDLHKLSKSDRQFLKRVAQSRRLDQPALAFVNPHILLEFAEAEPQAILEVRNLADKLFGHSLIEEIVHESISGEGSNPSRPMRSQ